MTDLQIRIVKLEGKIDGLEEAVKKSRDFFEEQIKLLYQDEKEKHDRIRNMVQLHEGQINKNIISIELQKKSIENIDNKFDHIQKTLKEQKELTKDLYKDKYRAYGAIAVIIFTVSILSKFIKL